MVNKQEDGEPIWFLIDTVFASEKPWLLGLRFSLQQGALKLGVQMVEGGEHAQRTKTLARCHPQTAQKRMRVRSSSHKGKALVPICSQVSHLCQQENAGCTPLLRLTDISIPWEVIRNTKRKQTHSLNISIREIPLMPVINKRLLSFPKI